MEDFIYLSSVCTGLTSIQRNAMKESCVFSHKMSDAIVSPHAKFKSPVWKYFGFPRVKNGDKVIIKASLTVF